MPKITNVSRLSLADKITQSMCEAHAEHELLGMVASSRTPQTLYAALVGLNVRGYREESARLRLLSRLEPALT